MIPTDQTKNPRHFVLSFVKHISHGCHGCMGSFVGSCWWATRGGSKPIERCGQNSRSTRRVWEQPKRKDLTVAIFIIFFVEDDEGHDFMKIWLTNWGWQLIPLFSTRFIHLRRWSGIRATDWDSTRFCHFQRPKGLRAAFERCDFWLPREILPGKLPSLKLT